MGLADHMTPMLRRTFLKGLLALPALVTLAPQPPRREMRNAQIINVSLVDHAVSEQTVKLAYEQAIRFERLLTQPSQILRTTRA